jgi:hypothetical protein
MERTMSVYTNAAWRSLARRMPSAPETDASAAQAAATSGPG